MNCLNPTYIKSPETRWLRKCIKEQRSFEYYYKHANARRNLLLDPVPLVNTPDEYYLMVKHPNQRVQRVPCGKCDNCIKSKINDYFVRCYYEWLDTNTTGTTYFCTLTFADELLPRLDNGTPCFDSEYIKAFLKRLRVYFQRKVGYLSEFKYFIVSEYGGEIGRPHHHALFFLPNWKPSLSNDFVFKEALAKSWTKIDDRNNWYANDELCFADMQRVDVSRLIDSRGIRYTSKYIGKQLGSESFDALNIDSRWKRRHFQSIGLGSCLTKYCDAEKFSQGFIEVDGFIYSLPEYYKRKLMREFYCWSDDGDIIYQPTAFARDSCRYFTMHKLQEYKDLSLLNKDFPRCPDLLYDPFKLRMLEDWLSKYNGFELQTDFSVLDPVFFEEIFDIVDAIQVFFTSVDNFYKPKYEAQASLFRQHQNERWLKKTGRK